MLGLFVVSGACTLVYQVVWVRMLVLVFGTSVHAVSTVVAAFMGGLALGALVFGKLADRRRAPLAGYAWLELGIGLFALASPFLFGRLDDVYTWVYRTSGGAGSLFALLRFLLGFAVLLVPTTLMGGTLPLLTKHVVRRADRLGGGLGRLYAANTFGAAAGCFVAAFVLLEQLGVKGTLWVAATGNLLVAAAAFALSRRGERADVFPAGESPQEEALPTRTVRAVFWGYAASGATALAFEVIWTRALSISLGITTTQSLSAILIVYLTGLAAGGAAGAAVADRTRHPDAWFAGLQIALGGCGLVSVLAFGFLPRLVEAWGPVQSWLGHMTRLFAVTACVILVPTLLMGVMFPLAGKIWARGTFALGTRIGGIAAANTAGSILGALAAGFVLISALGSQRSLILLAGVNVLIGAAVAATRRSWIAAAILPAALAGWLVPGAWMVDVYGRSEPGGELLHYEEDAGGTVTVFGYPDGMRLLKVNGAGEVPTDDAAIRTFRLLGSLPMLAHPDPQEVMVIAFGGGISLGTVELYGPRRIDCVEVVPAVLEAAPYFAEFNFGVAERFTKPHLRFIADDGRNHVLRTTARYDAIVSDSTHPGTADSWVLYTEEFYRLCRERLKDDGLMAQWLPLHGLAVDDFRMILRTFRRVFPEATFWWTEGYGIMLGTRERLTIDLERLASGLDRPAVRDALAPVSLADPETFLSALVFDAAALGTYVGDGPTNTDDLPYVSFADRNRPGPGGDLTILLSMGPSFVVDPTPSVTGRPEELERLKARFAAREWALRADVARRFGSPDRAKAARGRAEAIAPGATWLFGDDRR